MTDSLQRELVTTLASIFQDNNSHLNFGIHIILKHFRSSLQKLIFSDINQNLNEKMINLTFPNMQHLWSSLNHFYSSLFPTGKLNVFPSEILNSDQHDFSFHWIKISKKQVTSKKLNYFLCFLFT